MIATSNGKNGRALCDNVFCQKIADFYPDSGFFGTKSGWPQDSGKSNFIKICWELLEEIANKETYLILMQCYLCHSCVLFQQLPDCKWDLRFVQWAKPGWWWVKCKVHNIKTFIRIVNKFTIAISLEISLQLQFHWKYFYNHNFQKLRNSYVIVSWYRFLKSPGKTHLYSKDRLFNFQSLHFAPCSEKNNPLTGNGFTLPFPENFKRNYYFEVVRTRKKILFIWINVPQSVWSKVSHTHF